MTKRVEAAWDAFVAAPRTRGLDTDGPMIAALAAADAVTCDGDAIERAALAMHADLCACDRPDDENCIVYDDWRATVRRVIAALRNDEAREPSPHKGSGIAWPS